MNAKVEVKHPHGEIEHPTSHNNGLLRLLLRFVATDDTCYEQNVEQLLSQTHRGAGWESFVPHSQASGEADLEKAGLWHFYAG